MISHNLKAAIKSAREIASKLKPSRRWVPLQVAKEKTADGYPVYTNHIYTVTYRPYSEGWPFGGGPWAVLGVYSQDGEARHDFRDMQRIKNDVCGPEWEGLELFPAESRLMDPSNYYILYCAPKIAIGHYEGRRIMDAHNCIAPQRPFSK